MDKLSLKTIEEIVADHSSTATLVNVLPPESFEHYHIPGSINIPADNDDLVQRVKSEIPDPQARIILYCAGPQCPAARAVGAKLEAAGYSNVAYYDGGMEEWKTEGKALQTGSKQSR